MITYRTGDATKPPGEDLRVIVHVCNDVGAWGAGFTKALSARWDAPRRQYIKEHPQLGTVQHVQVEPQVWVANMVAQHGLPCRSNPQPLDYEKLKLCLNRVASTWASSDDVSFHMPRIGCGIARGDWDTVEEIIRRTLDLLHMPIYVYDLPG